MGMAVTKAATGLESFTDTAQAQAWFQERWPDKEFNFEGADMTVLGPALAHFVELADQFPFAIRGDRFKGIPMSSPTDPDEFSRKLSADAHAGVRRDDNMLLLNPASWGDPAEFHDALEAAELAEWHPPGAATPTAMMTHEFAHLLDRALTAETDTAWKEPYSETWEGHGKVAGDWLHWKKDADVLAVSGYAQRASRGAFGGMDNSERVAEAFSSIYHTPDDLKDEYVHVSRRCSVTWPTSRSGSRRRTTVASTSRASARVVAHRCPTRTRSSGTRSGSTGWRSGTGRCGRSRTRATTATSGSTRSPTARR